MFGKCKMLSVLDIISCGGGSGLQIKIVSVLFPELSPPSQTQLHSCVCYLFGLIYPDIFLSLSGGGQKFCCNCQVRKV